MKNKRIKLTQTGHWVIGVLLTCFTYDVFYHVANTFYPAVYYENDEKLFAPWLVFISISLVLSALIAFMLALDLNDEIMLENFTRRNWFTMYLFILFNIGSLAFFLVSWRKIRLFEIVDK